DERLRVQRRLAASYPDVVAIEGDVDRAEGDLRPGELLDQTAETVRERHAAGVDADQRDVVEPGVALDDLVGDAVEGAPARLAIQQQPLVGSLAGSLAHPTPFRPRGTGLKDFCRRKIIRSRGRRGASATPPARPSGSQSSAIAVPLAIAECRAEPDGRLART